MSTTQGFPDWQRITQWLGSVIVQATGLVIGAGTHTDGPVQVSNFASVIVALKATGGNVTVTITQTVPAGPASLVLTETVVVAAGATLFEAFVLYGGAVQLDLTGSVAGTSVDYALYGSNTTTNAQVITSATINVQHNEVLVAAEPTLDFVDVAGFTWGITDDAPNTRVKVTPPIPAMVRIADSILAAPAASIDFSGIPQTYKHLLAVAYCRYDQAVGFDELRCRINNDSAASYDFNQFVYSAAAVSGGESLGQTYARVGTIVGTTAAAGLFPCFSVWFNKYTDAADLKTIHAEGAAKQSNAAGGIRNESYSAGYRTAAAISRLTFFPPAGNFVAGTEITLYGVN